MAEQERWSIVKSSLGSKSVNDLDFTSFGNFSNFKKSLAASVHIHISYPFTSEQLQCESWWKENCKILPYNANKVAFSCSYSNLNDFKKFLAARARVAYPFTAEQLQSGSWWKENSKIIPYDANKVAFPCSTYTLVKDEIAVKPEDMFHAVKISVDPEKFRVEVYADKKIFDTALDEKRVAMGLSAWDMFPKIVGLSEEELGFYTTFWIPIDRPAFVTGLDAERVANGLNAWQMLDVDIIKHDVITKEQEDVITTRLARVPLPAESVSRRVSRLANYFSKHKFVKDRVASPPAIFFAERVEVQTKSDVAAMVKKHQE